MALSGLGGDELWGGYPSFRLFPRLRRLARLPGPGRAAGWTAGLLGPPRLRAKLRYLGSALERPATTYHLLRGLFTPAEIRALVSPEIWHEAGGAEIAAAPVEAAWEGAPESDWARVAVAEQCLYMRQQLLRDADWASMSHSVEVRVPLVDRRLTASLGPLLAAGGGGKASLASSPRPPLPPEVSRRPKTGFGLPLHDWVGEDCRAGRLPVLPSWLTGAAGASYVSRLAAGVARGRLHWSRVWALRVLGELLPGAAET